MASPTAHLLVAPDQREARVSVVIELAIGPSRHAVAVLAGLRAFAPMRIVVRVTGRALGSDLFLKKAARVARSARDVQMPTRQCEARLLFMVEDGLLPARLVMTILARRTETALVNVIDEVTRRTLFGCRREALVCMTERARCIHMRSAQRELRLAVIEARLSPCDLGVTIAAICPQLLPMRIVFPVAADAVRRRLSMQLRGGVTARAFERAMRALEGIVGVPMVERASVQPDRVGPASAMLGVTAPAGRLEDPRGPAMEAAAPLPIRRHIFVTVHAEPIFAGSIEGDVTLPALRLEFGVSFDDRAGRHEILDSRAAGASRPDHQDSGETHRVRTRHQ